MSRLVLSAVIILTLLQGSPAMAKSLAVLYFERPPYYLTLGGKPGGFLVDLTRRILAVADVPHEFVEMPPKRILEVIRTASGQTCSIGWFKNHEREQYAVFSHPIYQDRPLVAIFLRHGRVRPPEASSLKELRAQPGLSLGLNAAFSYGKTVDALIRETDAPLVNVNGTQEQLMRMLAAQRFDYILGNPEEIEALATLAGLKESDLAVVQLDDLPKGNLRYLMFSSNTPEETIRRVNEAIDSIIRLD